MPLSRKPIDEALAMAGIVKAKPATKPLDRSGAGTDEQLIGIWLDRYESPNTARAYRDDVDLFIAFLASLPARTADGEAGRAKALSEVKVAHLTAFAKHLKTEYSVGTHARRISAVKSLLTFAHETGYLPFNVGAAVKPPKQLNNLAERILSTEQVRLLIEASRPGRDRALIRFLYLSGARVSEATGLQWKHVHSDEQGFRVTLHGKGKKTRHIPLPASVEKDFEILEKTRLSSYVFESRYGRRLSTKDAWLIMRAAARKAYIRAPVSPHWLRHAHATHALRRGAPAHVVQQTLGHESLQTTSKYAHMDRKESSAMFLTI